MNLAAHRNAWARKALGSSLRVLGALVSRRTRSRLGAYAAEQAELRESLGITASSPLRDYDEVIRAAVRAVPGATIVRTSGSTNLPKEIAYTPGRLNSVKKAFAGATLRSVHATGTRRPVIFTLASLSEDDSLTSLMTGGEPSWLDCLITPHRILSQPALKDWVQLYGVNAARVWALVLCDPGWLYATNPSTQAVFFHTLSTDWDACVAMLREFRADPSRFGPEVRRLASRIVEPGWEARSDHVLGAKRPLQPTEWLNLEVHSSWDGGNTGAFLKQVRDWLPGTQFVPMFSMSTETLETLPVFSGGRAHFLPICPGVLYEFLPAEAPEDPASLLGPLELRSGQLYELVVSDLYGLMRYRTQDLFLCRGHLDGLPDLHFAHRRGLTFSFTGEKLTGQQLEMAYARLQQRFVELEAVHFSFIPSRRPEDRLPGYVLALATAGGTLPAGVTLSTLAETLDTELGLINEEYASKRSSKRLLPPVARVVDYDRLAHALRGGEDRNWDNQFKLLPLLRKTWQELGL